MKTFKKLLRLFIIYIILFFTFYTLHFFDKNGVIEEIVTNGSKFPLSNVIIYIVTALIISLIMTIVLNIPVIIGLIIANIVLKKNNKTFNNKNASDKKLDDLQYYREILNGYSPAELNYVYSTNSQFPKDAITTLLSLKLKNIIDLNDKTNTITILKDDLNLSNSEKYVLSKISDGKLKNFEPLPFQKIVQKDLENKGIINSDKLNIQNNSNNLSKLVIIIILAIMLISIFGIFIPITSFIMPLIIFGLMIGIPAFMIYIIIRAFNPYRLSKNGKELKKKLIGLKNYISQFSLLEEKDVKDLVLWEDYLIYSVIFDLNDDLISKMREKYIVFDVNSNMNNSEINLSQNSTDSKYINDSNDNTSNNMETNKKYINSNNENFNKAVNQIIETIVTKLTKTHKRNDK